MNVLINRSPNRLFVFGCSFTNYYWPTWANIVAYDLNIPFYNYGKIAAGNHYIFNTLQQADAIHNFNDQDLIMIAWTNVTREDRYIKSKWVPSGNIYTSSLYNSEYIEKYVDTFGFFLRDLIFLKSAHDLLTFKQCQFHFLKMIDFDFVNQWDTKNKTEFTMPNFERYQAYLNKCLPSFFDILWNNDIGLKFKLDSEKFYKGYEDGHPTALEHLTYLQKVFSKHNWKNETVNSIMNLDKKITNKINEAKVNGRWHRFVSLEDLTLNKAETSQILN